MQYHHNLIYIVFLTDQFFWQLKWPQRRFMADRNWKILETFIFMMHKGKMSVLKECLAGHDSLAENAVLYEDFKDWICEICTVKTSHRSQIKPKHILLRNFILNLAKLPC